jgi:hypothetical protein
LKTRSIRGGRWDSIRGGRWDLCGSSEVIALKKRLEVVTDQRDLAIEEASSYKLKFEEWFTKAKQWNQKFVKLPPILQRLDDASQDLSNVFVFESLQPHVQNKLQSI